MDSGLTEMPQGVLIYKGQKSPSYSLEILQEDISRLLGLVRRFKQDTVSINLMRNIKEQERE